MLQKVKGTRDLLPEDTCKWQYVEKKAKEIFDSFGVREIRVPVFEYTELFQRGVGETTDVVQKEMYTFVDKSDRSITLRPEGTAGVIRAYLENGMASKPSPVKLWYNMAMYRYENVQKGRQREFHQIGVEYIGTESYLADLELIILANKFLKSLNIPNIKLTINSIGCPKCRSKYQEILRDFIGKNLDNYCETCKTRFIKNPMRILDCKEKKCKEYNIGAPMMIDYLCEECSEHFEKVKNGLKNNGIDFEIDSSIVRGLDYYTKTVFEFIDCENNLTVLGGGRYDGLVEELGGVHTPSIGFGAGIERIMELVQKYNPNIENSCPDLYILSVGEEENKKAIQIAEALRDKGFYVEKDLLQRSFKAQMKYADKINSKNLLVIGEDELKSGKAKIKNMQTGEEKECLLDNIEILK